MNRTPNRGSWLVGAALILAVGASAVGLHAWRERGAWLRTPSGRVHYCVQFESAAVTRGDLEMYRLLLEARLQASFALPDVESVRTEPSTAFRPAYLQFALLRGSAEEGWMTFKQMLPQGRLKSRRLAWLDPEGEVVRLTD